MTKLSRPPTRKTAEPTSKPKAKPLNTPKTRATIRLIKPIRPPTVIPHSPPNSRIGSLAKS